MPLNLASWMMVFLRAGAMLTVFPVFSARTFPPQLRVALGALLACLIAPTVAEPVSAGESLWGLAGTMILEVGVGLLLGFATRMIFYALETAGAVIATEIGLVLPAGVNPLQDSQATVASVVLFYLATMLWLSLDLHHWLLLGFQDSYRLLPVGAARISQTLWTDLVGRTAKTFVVALQLAAPVLAVSFIITLVFSVLGRAVPQMNVFIESFSVRILAGLTVFGLTCQLMAQHIANYLRRLPEDVLRVAQILGVG